MPASWGWFSLQLTVKLKRIRGFHNPGSFDKESHYRAKHILWQATLFPGHEVQISKENMNNVLNLRAKIADKLEEKLGQNRITGMIEAMTLGLSTYLTDDEWNLFRRTGTTHLMVIAGTHIGFVTGIVFLLSRKIFQNMPVLIQFIPAQRLSAFIACMVTVSYLLISGIEVPAQRSSIGALVGMMRYFIDRRFTAIQGWHWGLWGVLLFEPHVVLHTGFYLSFIAVYILIVITKRYPLHSFWHPFLLQISCMIGLMPLTLYWFNYAAINGFVANIIAIPVVAWGIVPLSLLAILCMQLFDMHLLLWPLQKICELLYDYLAYVDKWDTWNITQTFNSIFYPIAWCLIILLWVLWPIQIYRWVGCLLAILISFPKYMTIHDGDLKIDILDVGQGLSVVLRTSAHTLIYDTGMAFFPKGDMGQSVIIPYINNQGIKHIDAVVISHPDLDHRGGLNSLMKNIPVKKLWVNDPDYYHMGSNCHYSKEWEWDGLIFKFIPILYPFSDRNNTSCVLQVLSKDRKGIVLLPGDIEKPAESYLVNQYGDTLQSRLLVPAHHGSKTSTSINFLKKISPDYAVLSYGFMNRYHFPSLTTLQSLSQNNTIIYNTVQDGMRTFIWDARKKQFKTYGYSDNLSNFLDLIMDVVDNA
jgi:competence protein ComEC